MRTSCRASSPISAPQLKREVSGIQLDPCSFKGTTQVAHFLKSRRFSDPHYKNTDDGLPYPKLQVCKIQVQTTLVACPRNQRYLRPRGVTLGVFVCESNQGRKHAVEFNLQVTVLWDEADLVDQSADRLGRL